MGVAWQAGVMGVWGCAAGMFYGLNNLLMTRVVGLERLTSVYSARNLLGALGFFAVGPVVGESFPSSSSLLSHLNITILVSPCRAVSLSSTACLSDT